MFPLKIIAIDVLVIFILLYMLQDTFVRSFNAKQGNKASKKQNITDRERI